jgi:hypothetical protein
LVLAALQLPAQAQQIQTETTAVILHLVLLQPQQAAAVRVIR